jgi:hypothetical protein
MSSLIESDEAASVLLLPQIEAGSIILQAKVSRLILLPYSLQLFLTLNPVPFHPADHPFEGSVNVEAALRRCL